MHLLLRAGLRRAIPVLGAAACLAGLATLLTCAALRPHLYLNHFRAADLRSAAGARPFVDQSKNDLTEAMVAIFRESGTVPRLDPPQQAIPALAGRAPDIMVLPVRVTLRLKLGPPGRAPSDPLL